MLGFAFAGDTWRNWLTILAGAFGLPLSDEGTATFHRLTQRGPLTSPCRELLVLAGRRGGKSHIAAAIAVYLATLKRWSLSVGEVGTVLIVAADRDQARVAFRYVLGLIEASPILAQEIHGTTLDTIRLHSGIEICIGTSDKAAVRGRTLIAVVCDEIAFWGADADEVLRAIRPGMASQPDAMLVMITTTYSQRGPAFELFRRGYGIDDDHLLVVRATTRQLNNTIPQAFVDAELERDPQAARAEYLSEFRSDLEALFDAALIDSVTRAAPRELPRLPTLRGGPLHYLAAVDISGGRQDSTAAAIAHVDGERVVVDAVRHWPAPHDPAVVAAEVAAMLAEYGLSVASSDAYGAELSRSIYSQAGVALAASEYTRSDAYLRLLPLCTTGRVELPDDPTLRRELLALERRTGRIKDVVDHPPGAHDDVANAVALVAAIAGRTAATPLRAEDFVLIPGDDRSGLHIGSGVRGDLNALEHRLAMNGLITS